MSTHAARRFALSTTLGLVALGAGGLVARSGPAASDAAPKDEPEIRRRAVPAQEARQRRARQQVKDRYSYFRFARKVYGTGTGKKITFTFDDGPHYRTTPRLLDHLQRFGVTATFFVNGKRFNPYGLIAAKNYAVLAETHRRGHLLGNHTYGHPHLPSLAPALQSRQIDQTANAIRQLTGVRCTIFRPPYGALSPHAERLFQKRGTMVVLWNLSSDDDQHFNVSKVLNKVMYNLGRKGGGILLMHDTHYWSIEATPAIIQAIRIEACKQLAAGEEPYEIVGLEYFQVPRFARQKRRPRPGADSWLTRRAAMVNWCAQRARVALPAFLREKSI